MATTSPLRPSGPFGHFADRLLTIELPGLPADRRHDTVDFVCRRADRIPAPLRLGLVALTAVVGASQRFVGEDRTATFLTRTSLPLVGELPRMVRSLAFAYVWETWPRTRADGGPG